MSWIPSALQSVSEFSSRGWYSIRVLLWNIQTGKDIFHLLYIPNGKLQFIQFDI